MTRSPFLRPRVYTPKTPVRRPALSRKSRAVAWLSRLWAAVGLYLLNLRKRVPDATSRLWYRPGMQPPTGYALNGRGDLVNIRRELMRQGVNVNA